VSAECRGGRYSLDRGGPTSGQSGVDEGLVFGLGHSIMDDQLDLIEGWRVEHVVPIPSL
jgi:hypothetical protein